jgi:hypothetical protein
VISEQNMMGPTLHLVRFEIPEILTDIVNFGYNHFFVTSWIKFVALDQDAVSGFGSDSRNKFESDPKRCPSEYKLSLHMNVTD